MIKTGSDVLQYILAPGEQQQLGILLKLKQRCDRFWLWLLYLNSPGCQHCNLFCLMSPVLLCCNCLFYSLPPCFWCVGHSFLFLYLYLFSFYLSRERQLGAQCSFLSLLHIHTWELPTVITVLSHAAMCSSSRAVPASLICFFEGKEKVCYCYTGISTGNRPVPDLYLQAITVLFIMKHLPCVQTTARAIKCHFYDKFTGGQTDLSPLQRQTKPNGAFPRPRTADIT